MHVPGGLVLADDGHARVAVVHLGDEATKSGLPTLPGTSGALDLTATEPDNNLSTSYYTVTGTFKADGEEFELEGSVDSYRFQEYITTAALPPARLRGKFYVRSPRDPDVN